MIRLSVLLVLGSASVVLAPNVASAQFGGRFGGFGGVVAPPGRIGPGGVPVIVPSFNPFFYVPQYRYTYGYSIQAGGFSFGTRYSYVGVNPPAVWGLYAATPAYLQSGAYMTGGSTGRADIVLSAQRAVAQAQREGALAGARDQIAGQWKYEKGTDGVAVAPPDDPAEELLRKALVVTDPAEVASGEALNAILKEIIRAEAKGGKGPSAYIPPLLLADVRFAGSPAADLLTLARLADNLPFPAAFDDPALSEARTDLDRAFSAAAVAVQAGKGPEAAKLATLEASFERLQTAAAPVLKNLPFEEAAAARRFVNRVGSAIKGMKGNAPNGLVDPKWSAEGLTVADLVRQMTRFKLQFGPAAPGSEEAYMTMHRNLATYLVVVTPPKK